VLACNVANTENFELFGVCLIIIITIITRKNDIYDVLQLEGQLFWVIITRPTNSTFLQPPLDSANRCPLRYGYFGDQWAFNM